VLGGNGSLFLDKNFSCSDHNFVFCAADESTTCYVYYYLKYNWTKVLNLFHGSTIDHIGKENLCDLGIPVPADINSINLDINLLKICSKSLQSIQILYDDKKKYICELINLLTTACEKFVDYDEYNIMDLIKMKSGSFNSKDMITNGMYPFYNASVNNLVGTINEYCFDGDKYILFIKVDEIVKTMYQIDMHSYYHFM